MLVGHVTQLYNSQPGTPRTLYPTTKIFAHSLLLVLYLVKQQGNQTNLDV